MTIDDITAFGSRLELTQLLPFGQVDVVLVLEDLELHETCGNHRRPAAADREHHQHPALEVRTPPRFKGLIRPIVVPEWIERLPARVEEAGEGVHRCAATIERAGVDAVVRSMTMVSAEDGGDMRSVLVA